MLAVDAAKQTSLVPAKPKPAHPPLSTELPPSVLGGDQVDWRMHSRSARSARPLRAPARPLIAATILRDGDPRSVLDAARGGAQQSSCEFRATGRGPADPLCLDLPGDGRSSGGWRTPAAVDL